MTRKFIGDLKAKIWVRLAVKLPADEPTRSNLMTRLVGSG